MCAHFDRVGYFLWNFCLQGREGKNPDSLLWFGGKTVVVEGLSHSRPVLEKAKEAQNLNLDTGYINHENTLPMAVWNGTYEAAFFIKSMPFMAMKNLG